MKRKTHINIYLQLLFQEFWENILGTSQKSSNMWSKGRNAEVSPSVCYETGKLLIPAKSVKSRHTSSGCLNFSQKKIKRRKRSGGLGHENISCFICCWDCRETSHEDPSKASRRVGSGSQLAGEVNPQSRRGVPQQGMQSSAINRMYNLMPACISCYEKRATPPPNCPRVTGASMTSRFLLHAEIQTDQRSCVLSFPFFFFFAFKLSKSKVIKLTNPKIALLYQLASLLPVCTVQCLHGATAAGNVSPAPFLRLAAHSRQHGPFSPSSSHSTADFCPLTGKHKLQVITSRFSCAQTMGIYSSGFLFKLSR